MENKILASRIYEVTVKGYDESFKQLQEMTKAFESMDAAKRKLNSSLQTSVASGDDGAVKRLTAEIEALKKKMVELDRQQQQSAKEALLLAKAQREQEKVQQEQIKTQRLKNQEADRTVKAQKAEQKAIDDLSNDYKQLSIAYNEAALRAKNMAIVMGENHPLAKEAAKDAADLHDQLLRLDKSTGDSRRNVGNYGQALHSLNQVLREAPAFANSAQTGFMAISNNIPMLTDQFKILSNQIDENTGKQLGWKGALKIMLGGLFSWQTLMIGILTTLPLVAKSMGENIAAFFTGNKVVNDLSSATGRLAQKLEEMKLQMEKLNAAFATTDYSNAVRNVFELTTNIQLAKQGLLDKEKVLHQFNTTIGKTIGEEKNLADAEKALIENGQAYINMMLYKAAANLALEDAAKKAVEAEKLRRQKEEDFISTADKVTTATFKLTDNNRGNRPTGDQFAQVELNNARARKEAMVKEQQDAADEQRAIAEKFQKDAADIAANMKFDFFSGTEDPKKPKKEKADKGSALSLEEREEIKRLEARRNAALKSETEEVESKREFQQLTVEEEIQHLENLQAINNRFDREKIAAIKGHNNAENEARSELENKIVERRRDTNKKVQELNNKAFAEDAELRKKLFEKDKGKINLALDIVNVDPTKSEEDKARAKKNANAQLLQATEAFYADMIAKAKRYNVDTVQLEEERDKAIQEVKRGSLKNDQDIFNAHLKDLKEKGAVEVQEIQNKYSKLRKKILDNDKLSFDEKKKLIDELDKAERRTVLSAELEQINKEVEEKKKAYEDGLISNKEYLDAVAIQIKKSEELSQSSPNNTKPKSVIKTAGQLIQKSLSSLFGFGENSENEKLLGQAISESYALAQDAMHSYFQAEEERIQRSKELAFERIDLEKKQLLAKAQSGDEAESIERQAAEKKRKVEKEAGEKLKKVKKSEAKIALATELANIGVAAASNPLNGVTLGAAGVAMYALLAGLALARYALNVKNIDQQQFAGGGRAKKLNSGKITVEPNISTQPNGDNVLATVKTGEVILNEQQQAALGGDDTFRRIGVPGFGRGGKVLSPSDILGTVKTEGQLMAMVNRGSSFLPLGFLPLGDNLKPPIDSGSFLNPVRRADDFSELKELVGEVAEAVGKVNNRIDRIRVVNDPRETTKVSDKYKAASEIGTL